MEEIKTLLNTLNWEEEKATENEIVLKTIVEELLILVHQQVDLYSDMRSRLVHSICKNSDLSYETQEIISINPGSDNNSLEKLKKLVQIVNSRLKQVQYERDSAKTQNENLKEQLLRENEYLKNELSRARKNIL